VAFDLLLAICSATTFGLMIIMLLLLPEANGRSLAPWRLRRPEIDRCRMPIRGFDDFRDGPSCVIVPERVPAMFREWRRPTG